MNTRNGGRLLSIGAALLLTGLAGWGATAYLRAPNAGTYAVPGEEPMTLDTAQQELFILLPALLFVVYDAFSKTQEAEIYDTLEQATAGEALDALYLDRAGAMVGGGLTESDQIIHEMRVTKAAAQASGETLTLDAEWEVIGTVGHSEHVHIRGNTYRAHLTIAPVDGAWKITDFDLTGIDRQTAGERIEVEDSATN